MESKNTYFRFRSGSFVLSVFVYIFFFISSTQASESMDFHLIPFDVDPPLKVDADLDDWMDIPNPIYMQSKEHATYQYYGDWKGPKDLSAVVRLAWRDGLYLAAEVTDDVIQQPYSGEDIWKGDYVALWLDMKPTFKMERTVPGEGQFQIGISPGNFGGVIKPQIVIFLPRGVEAKGAKVASRRTDKGYVVEAFIPFALLDALDVKQNTYARFEVTVSDSDDKPSRQQKMISVGTKKWSSLRTRLLPMIFADGNGDAILPVSSTEILKQAVLSGGRSQTFKFNLDEIPTDRDTLLFFNARAALENCGGYCSQGLSVKINENRLEEDYFANRPSTGMMRRGKMQKLITPAGWLTLPWAPDFTSTDKHKSYAIEGQKASEFEFLLTGFLKEGENTLTFSPRTRMITSGKKQFLPEIVVGNVELRIKPKTARSGLLSPAPKGELPVYEPLTVLPKTFNNLKKRKTVISFGVNGESYAVESRFSTPDGKWNTGSTKFFEHTRKVKQFDEWIVVHDTFRNLTNENLPLMQSHTSTIGKQVQGVWLKGSKVPIKSGRGESPANPSAFAVTETSGVGLVALNDEFRVHIEQTVKNGNIAIADRSFVLKPGAEYTAEWAIVPVTKPDFWRFVNTARRMLDTNFTLKYTFAFMMQMGTTYKDWSDATFKRFVDNKSADFLVQANYAVPTRDGKPARCTDWLAGPHDVYENFQKRVRRLYPDGSKKTGIYYHCFLDTHEANAKRFPADRALDAKGNHIKYGEGKNSYMKLFVPTLENDWSKEIAKVPEVILDKIGADGIFWDEFTHSNSKYIYNTNMWDGCSADINQKTHKIERLKNSLALLSLDFRERLVKRILKGGSPFLINGAPHTRTLSRYKFMAFGETGSATHLRTLLLYSPVGLGDHLTEKTGKDAYRNMLKALDQGSLYAWYATYVIPKHKMLTEYMYPFTPIELHNGYVVGHERILTNRSGLFGWNDTSEFETHVFDREGKETDKYPVRRVERQAKTYAEVRIPGGYSCAIVRITP